VDVRPYLLSQDGLDAGALFAHWEHLLPDAFTLWLLNRFGEAILVFDDGSVHRLSPELGALEALAPDREAFHRAVDRPENAAAWLRLPDVDAAVAAGHALGRGQCYGFAIPLVLGGERTLANLRVWDLDVYHSFLADVHRGTRDLPDGTRVRLVPRPK
jgi:hypothetical protein